MIIFSGVGVKRKKKLNTEAECTIAEYIKSCIEDKKTDDETRKIYREMLEIIKAKGK